MKEQNKRVHYICYYCDEQFKNEYIYYPSVLSKIDYVITSLRAINMNVTVVSTVNSKKSIGKKRMIKIDENETHKYLSSFTGKRVLTRRLNLIWKWIQIILYFLRIPKDDIVLVYHSLSYCLPLKLLKQCFGKKYILEIEDIFSAVNDADKDKSDMEWKSFKYADGYVSVNDIIADELDKNKKIVISYGSYKLPKFYRSDRDDDKIKLIYAGVIERVRNGAFIAIESMRELPDNYELNICGFGNEDNIAYMKDEIKRVNNELGREAVVFLGYKTGSEYEQILQSCDIALSTHIYDEESMKSADYTYPSKTLVYLANGLRIVAQNLNVLRRSQIGDLIYYYDEPKPCKIAEVIRNIDLKEVYKPEERLKVIEEKFVDNLKTLIGD